VSRAVSLCDMHAKYADVAPTAEILSYVSELPATLFYLLAGKRSPAPQIKKVAE
jgi:maleamate amidohydrolase